MSLCKCWGGDGVQGVQYPSGMTTDKCITRLITTLVYISLQLYICLPCLGKMRCLAYGDHNIYIICLPFLTHYA